MDKGKSPAAVTRRSGSSFLAGFLFLGRERRRALEAVYAFCRMVDDAADAPGDREQARKALDGFRREAQAACAGRPASALGEGLAAAAGRFGVREQELLAVVDGCEMDLAPRRYATIAELEGYCRLVACAVGRMCVAVFGAPEALDYADATGMALQLTNILRDVAEDLGRGRVYLPLEDLERFGVEERELGGGTDRVRALLAFQAGRARGWYAESDRLLPREKRRSLLPGEVMKAVYRDLLGRLERAGRGLPRERIRAGKARAVYLAGRVWVRSLLGGG